MGQRSSVDTSIISLRNVVQFENFKVIWFKTRTNSARMDYIMACAILATHQHVITDSRYNSGSHTRVHRVFTDIEHPHHCWPCGLECVTVAHLRTGHSPLLVAYLHRIRHRDSATCPHCNGADETAEHLVSHCPAHDQARRESWPNLHCQSDPSCLWSFLERIGVVTPPAPRPGMRERERERYLLGPFV